MPALINLHGVTVRYGNHIALQDVSGQIQAGSLTALAGPNGAGKSTLLKAIAGILTPVSGRVEIAATAQHSIAYLPQGSAMERDFPLTVLESVCVGFWPRLGNAGAITRAKREQAAAAIAEIGLAGLEGRQIGSLSGGQFQRMLFARLLLQDAQIMLLDEPFAGVDAQTVEQLMRLLLHWHGLGRTIICVLHDLLLIKKYFPDSFVLAGKCLGSGHTHTLFEQKLLSFDLDMAELCPGNATAGTHSHAAIKQG